MKPKLKLHLVRGNKKREETPGDNLKKPGDYYITVMGTPPNSYEAIILKCPYCGMEMASMGIHKIRKDKHGVSVVRMLQCPYNPAHRFRIRKSNVIEVRQPTMKTFAPNIDGNQSQGIHQRAHVPRHPKDAH
jgi:hypothetical protein